jgi:glycosyltransferase involved in cell wall biosynthesis
VKQPKIGVFIIAYNAVDHLAKTLARIPRETYEAVEEIFVIDDCSRDNTYAEGLRYKEEYGLEKLTIHRNTKNQGYGGNQKVGYQYALDRGLDIVALVHGDGQYAPEMLPVLLQPLVTCEGDMVMGSRMAIKGAARRGGMPLYKFVGNKILTRMQNRLTGMELSEYHSGYRLYSMDALRSVPFASFSNVWHFDTQIILAFAERGLKIKEIPIPTYYGDEICHVNGIPYALNCIATCVEYKRNRSKGLLSFPGPLDVPKVGENKGLSSTLTRRALAA